MEEGSPLEACDKMLPPSLPRVDVHAQCSPPSMLLLERNTSSMNQPMMKETKAVNPPKSMISPPDSYLARWGWG